MLENIPINELFCLCVFVVELTDDSLTDEPRTRADFLRCEFFFSQNQTQSLLSTNDAPQILKLQIEHKQITLPRHANGLFTL